MIPIHRRSPSRSVPRPFALLSLRFLCVLLAVPAFPGVAAAQEVTLAWRFRPGEVLDYRQTTETRVGMPEGEMAQKQEVRARMEVLRVAPDGAAELRYTFVSIRTVMDGPGGHQEYDSERDPEPGAAGFDPTAGLAGASLGMTMAPDGRIRSLEGMEALVERAMEPLLQASPQREDQVRAMMREVFDEDRLIAQMQQTMATLPAGAVRPGEEWSTAVDVMLPFGSARTEQTYHLRDVTSRGDRRVAVLGMTGAMGPIEADPNGPMAGLLKVSGSETSGTVEFDVDRGVLLAMTLTTVMESEAMGTPMRVETTHRTELVGK